MNDVFVAKALNAVKHQMLGYELFNGVSNRLMDDAKTLHVFLHMPKAGGSSIVNDIRLSHVYNKGTITGNMVRYMLRNGYQTTNRRHLDEFIRSIFSSFTDMQHAKLSVFWGHHVTSVISEVCKKPVRYHAMFRDPLSHHISFYNYCCDLARSKKTTPALKIDSGGNMMQFFDPEGPPPFRNYVRHLKNSNVMCAFLVNRGFLSRECDAAAIRRCIESFAVAGVFDQFEESRKAMLGHMGIRSHQTWTNKPREYAYRKGDDKEAEAILLERANMDRTLYDEARCHFLSR